jgi:transcriptional regulator with XRE-family HTH domain
MNVAELIKTMRAKKNMSLEQLADITGLSERYIFTWEHGRSKPNKTDCAKLAAAFGIALEGFYEDE